MQIIFTVKLNLTLNVNSYLFGIQIRNIIYDGIFYKGIACEYFIDYINIRITVKEKGKSSYDISIISRAVEYLKTYKN